MTRTTKHRLWTVSVTLVLLPLLAAGTTLACMQREVGTVQTAQDCCRGHCQHAMEAEMAMQCCQSHQPSLSQVLPVAAASKTVSLAVAALPIAVMPPAEGQAAKPLWVPLSPTGHLARLPALYTLHCSLLR